MSLEHNTSNVRQLELNSFSTLSSLVDSCVLATVYLQTLSFAATCSSELTYLQLFVLSVGVCVCLKCLYLSFLCPKPNSSPYLSASNPNACRAIGRGLQPKGVRVKEVADFKVYCRGAGSGDLRVIVKNPSKSFVPVKFH